MLHWLSSHRAFQAYAHTHTLEAEARGLRPAPPVLADAVALEAGRAGGTGPHRVLALGALAAAASPAALVVFAHCRARSLYPSSRCRMMQRHDASALLSVC